MTLPPKNAKHRAPNSKKTSTRAGKTKMVTKAAKKPALPKTAETPPSRPMAPTARFEFFRRLRELNPEPKTELEYSSAFELLIAVLLSAQATDVSVNKATRKLFPIANTPQALLDLGEDGLRERISTIGLYKAKAANTIATCRLLLERHGGEVPGDREFLEALPGVGRKTANVVLNTWFRQPAMAVDTHIFRVANRTGLAPGKDVRVVEDALMKRVPAEFLMDAHHWLILHGRYVCKAQKPDCGLCVVRDLCQFRHKAALSSPS
ncbi:DNA-(apurinic or apyrimidinic site) lyase /endonuclease III [Aquimonas voraii]|uniref:Endonuclease III n=2 Tax=Aquimonas voraii TaxID=265719 RepID=A0A1G6SLJ2_9GAMM|nr:DNA-(apurinic or apyrimidinic site) lyase /endonuclease III [Aquimonas voraii]